MAIKTTNNITLGDRLLIPFSSTGLGVCTFGTRVVVIVTVGVGVDTGKISVISGSGINVVVAVIDGVIKGVEE